MRSVFSRVARGVGRSLLGGMTLALALLAAWSVFMLLPLLEQVTRPARGDLEIRSVGSVDLPPPPPPPPPESPPEAEPEELPQEVAEPAAPLDLAQLEMVLNAGAGDGFGEFALRLPGLEGSKMETSETDDIFSAADLDQLPRPVAQPAPDYPPDLRRQRVAGTVIITFIVDRTGRVQNPAVEQSPHPRLAAAATAAVRKWRFEPGKRQGNSVSFKMRVPITFVPM